MPDSLPSSSKPRLLDLFCGAGGCAKGYQRAGFYVVGIDVKDQPNYCGDEFIQADALEFMDCLLDMDRYYGEHGRVWNGDGTGPAWRLRDFAVVHASPPCPHYSLVSGFQGVGANHPDLIAPTRAKLDASALPYVIENVPGAPLRRDLVLCGEMFGLRVHRHRLFETSGFFAMQPPHSRHILRGGKTNCETGPGIARWITGNYADHDDAGDAMGIDWMGRRELANAVPPAYTEHIGHYLMLAMAGVADAA